MLDVFIPMKKAPDWALWSISVAVLLLAYWPFNIGLVAGAAYARKLRLESRSRSGSSPQSQR